MNAAIAPHAGLLFGTLLLILTIVVFAVLVLVMAWILMAASRHDTRLHRFLSAVGMCHHPYRRRCEYDVARERAAALERRTVSRRPVQQ